MSEENPYKKPFWKWYCTLSDEAKKEYHKVKMRTYRKKKREEKLILLRQKKWKI